MGRNRKERIGRTGCCVEICTETPLPLLLEHDVDGLGAVIFSTRGGWVVSGIVALLFGVV